MWKKIINYIKDPRTLIIIVLVVVILFMGYCGGCGDKPEPVPNDTTYTEVILPGDSIPYHDTIEVPKPYKVYDHDTLYVYYDVDTPAIIISYYEENFYDILMRDDTSMTIRIKFSVWQNKPSDLELEAFNHRPWHISQTIVQPPDIIQERKVKMFAGITVGGSADRFSLAPGVLFQYKSFLSGLNYEVFSKSVNIPLYYKLSVKSKKKK